MSVCPGKRSDRSGSCNTQLYKCKYCNNVGCDQNREICSNQAFMGSRCLQCNKAGGKETFR